MVFKRVHFRAMGLVQAGTNVSVDTVDQMSEHHLSLTLTIESPLPVEHDVCLSVMSVGHKEDE